MNDDDDLPPPPPPPAPKRSGGFILAVLGVTILGAAGGATVGMMQVNSILAEAHKRANEPPTVVETALAWDESTGVARLEPVIANLAQPAGTWVRLDTAIVFDREKVDDLERMKSLLSQDILTFLRTVSIGDIAGPSGFGHLRDDLNERVRHASRGVVSELMIEAMVLQ
jgi:flagellar FliL protein